ncbi:hypothetical protein PPL_09256 [Heterostelium album PN500]|uniref:Uncharacterized protein n=1 Tax=Heterostelium pallidum (strain ATCC 26659 / Pp 5 / PN500) TaxID=670386 RepID=D3BL24_HETP5|nr:hypothetical protein PPL_09256 [Heterostelium album PN500]EFA77758.1 hypothetical protein PPL_09256 [Heterostelium album PN500]|eukprot:XP_020429886.1 hypothetical protein PPL_09256 [Heterostelium album PN500]
MTLISSITKLGSSVQSNQSFKNELMMAGINGNSSIGQTSNSTESLINLNILANVLASITKLGSVQNNSMIKSQIGGVSGVNSTQSLNSVACNPGNDVDVHVLLCANILGINIYANVNVDL